MVANELEKKLNELEKALHSVSSALTGIKELLSDERTLFKDIPVEKLGVSANRKTRFLKTCIICGIKTIPDLLTYTKEELLRKPGMGIGTILDVSAALKREYNINW
ncbi:MAG: hypothetical protein J5733_05850 [Bacteroidaceae bacterium]|nr:hypothetical protein [Bacteroidaceae bacterium]